MFLKVRKLVPAHRSRLLRFAAGLRERTAREPTLQDHLGLVGRKWGTEAEGGCKEGSTSAAGATQEERGSVGTHITNFSEKDWGVPHRDSQISEEFTSTQTPKKCDPRAKTEQKIT